MARTREIKKRMVAVGNISRITKTMQMIATAKFTAAVQRANATKPYTKKIRQLVAELTAASGDIESPLVAGPEQSPRRELLLVISSDRGLCGAYNGNVLRNALNHIRKLRDANIAFDLETVGKKAVGFFKFQHIDVSDRHRLSDPPKYEEVERLASRMIEAFVDGRYDAVRIVSMRFESNSRQIPSVLQLLPLKPEAAEDAGQKKAAPGGGANYDFSPSSEELLDDLLPLAVKTSLFQAVNDAIVSEHIMRMVAMKSATENAKDLGRSLRRQFNRARQSQITTELTEIISGAAALE